MMRERLATVIVRTGEHRGGLQPVTSELRVRVRATELADIFGRSAEFEAAWPVGEAETIRSASDSTYIRGRELDGAMDVTRIRELIDTSDGTSDPGLGEICRLQGYDRLPVRTDAQGVDSVVAAGGREFFRGVTDPRFADEFKTGSYFPGRASVNATGNGTYVTTVREVAQNYADGNPAGVIRMALRPDARITHLRTLDDEHHDWIVRMNGERDRLDAMEQTPEVTARLRELEDAWWVNSDLGRFAASRGYDAYETLGGYARYDDRYWVVLNRSALIVER
ncbi:hypothetical protein [Nocardia aurantia]|uniref:hypothetical protein n=1 Tax=Nocardia aurantia TaxID=2585199 RepID=UPI0018862F29|nr:hypothetical protein [Nocardia aurantia]